MRGSIGLTLRHFALLLYKINYDATSLRVVVFLGWLGRFCIRVRTAGGCVQQKSCAFLFGEVLHGAHFGNKNKSGDVVARLTYDTLRLYDKE